ncbi:RNA methyltransferase [Clostridium estertheticum]|uniref:TRM11 family SAM-dependent methyltransferase n=1 Tax=Clostridium estertheticum TaxID=238834 RepID=UPI0013EED60E|nr:RNA methyltransferase [Clostridium estertheticum]MBZ9608011.1 RNA methyltransferase [Clostridium estertheticum]
MFQLPQNEKKYLYTTNYSSDEESLCKMEIKCLFNKHLDEKHLFSDIYVDPSRSPFIKKCISIMYTGETMKQIIDQIAMDKLTGINYKVAYINATDENIGFHERRRIEFEIGFNILGEAEMKNPEIIFGITKIANKWIFGECESNVSDWLLHNKKPFSYSNALKVNVCRALVNIAVANNLNCSVVDPCCGIGTVLIEAISMDINIKGYEINPYIGENAKANLRYFGYDDVITICDMNDIANKFNVAIVDLPYGIFTQITTEEQLAIISSTRRIADRMVIITFDDMEEQITSVGFHIDDRCTVSKGTFKRHIFICS